MGRCMKGEGEGEGKGEPDRPQPGSAPTPGVGRHQVPLNFLVNVTSSLQPPTLL